VEIEHYRGAKKPKMPAAKAKKSVTTMKFLASVEISLNRAQETDFAFLQDVITSDNCTENRKSAILHQRGHFDPKFQVQGVTPTNNFCTSR